MLVRLVREYIVSISDTAISDDAVWRELDEAEGHALATRSNFSLAALPPDLQVKIVTTCGIGTSQSIFLLLPNTLLGDEILTCIPDPSQGHDKVFLNPVLRPYNYDLTATSETRCSFLIGWALYVTPAGHLKNTEFRLGDLLFGSGSITYNLHYEDLILHATLRQDLAAYLSQSCTHPDHPSFLMDRKGSYDSKSNIVSYLSQEGEFILCNQKHRERSFRQIDSWR